MNMLDKTDGPKRPDEHNSECRCPKCVTLAIDEIKVKCHAETIYFDIQRTTKAAYAKLDSACLSNPKKAAAYRLAMGWAIRWLAQTAPELDEPFGSKINNI